MDRPYASHFPGQHTFLFTLFTSQVRVEFPSSPASLAYVCKFASENQRCQSLEKAVSESAGPPKPACILFHLMDLASFHVPSAPLEAEPGWAS